MDVLILEDLYYTAEWISARVDRVFPGAKISICHSIREARKKLEVEEFNLVLLDINLPDGNSLCLVDLYKKRSPGGMAVCVTIYDDDSHIFDAICSGIDGYLIKSTSELIFEKKLADISHGDPPMSPTVARKILRYTRGHLQEKPVAHINSDLTERELEVLTLISKGLSRVEIAGLLELSPHTVAKYIKMIYRKLGISSRAEATLAACKMGLVSFDQV